MKKLGKLGLAAALLLALAAWEYGNGVKAAGGPGESANGAYCVLAPIESGNLLLFPVVRADGKSSMETPFITLDEGLKSGEVEVTEAGRARGLVRRRGTVGAPPYNGHDGGSWDGVEPQNQDSYRGDEVNTLVLVNHSKRPLLLLAGEVVTGGKQDRIVAKDRIVPADADPIDLSVFCIEPGRWTESSAEFGASDKSLAHSFMVQPAVRERAMVDQNQQQVWDSVHGAIAEMEVAVAPSASAGGGGGAYEAGPPMEAGTTSYAKVMQSAPVREKVDEAAAPVTKAREEVLAKLRDEHAVGVVVVVRGEIVWADLFASTDLLARYWTKLVRSYAAESLTEGENHSAPSVADAQHFLDMPSGGTENSEGDVGIYRYRELKSGSTETFVLESLLPGTGYDVHVSKMKLIEVARRVPRPHPIRPHPVNPQPNDPPVINPHPIYEPQVYHPDVYYQDVDR
jgi:hypothetical protein